MAKEIGSWGQKPESNRPRARRVSPSPPVFVRPPTHGSSRIEPTAKRLLEPRLTPNEKLIWASSGSGLAIGWHLPFTILRTTVLSLAIAAFVGGLSSPSLVLPLLVVLLFGILAHEITLPMFQVYGLTQSRLIVVHRLFPVLSRSFGRQDVTALNVMGSVRRGSIILSGPWATATVFGRLQAIYAPSAIRGVPDPVGAARLVQAVIASGVPVNDRTS